MAAQGATRARLLQAQGLGVRARAVGADTAGAHSCGGSGGEREEEMK